MTLKIPFVGTVVLVPKQSKCGFDEKISALKTEIKSSDLNDKSKELLLDALKRSVKEVRNVEQVFRTTVARDGEVNPLFVAPLAALNNKESSFTWENSNVNAANPNATSLKTLCSESRG